MQREPSRRPAPYRHEVDAEVAKGRNPDVEIFAGPGGFLAAERRRIEYGPGSALVLPGDTAPEDFDWPNITPVNINVQNDLLKRRLQAACTHHPRGW